MNLNPLLNERRSTYARRLAASASAVAIVATLTSGAASDAASAHASTSLVVSALKTSTYGTVLQSTRTLYTLTPSKVACTAKCLTYWPEVLLPKGTTKAVAGPGVSGAKLGTIKRPGGRLQVTYAGKALYWFAKDKVSGQVKGNLSDTWGKWSVVVLIKPEGGGSPTTTTTTGGGGGGIGF